MELLLVLILVMNFKVCKVDNLCRPNNPCKNGGRCNKTDFYPYYSCSCMYGYSGINCQIDPCRPNNPCKNGGRCNKTDLYPYYSCSCMYGYSGINCQIDVCSPSPCLNDGTCSRTNTNSNYSCSCKTGYSGNNCTIDVCSPNPCLNDGNCSRTNTNSNYSCSCKTGYSGNYCTIETTKSISSVSTPEISKAKTTVSAIETSPSTTTIPSTSFSSRNSTSMKSDESSFQSQTSTARRQGDKTTVAVSVTVPVFVFVVCAVLVGVCLIRRWKHKKGLGTTALERSPGIAISNTSYRDHQVNIPKAASVHVPDGTSNEYAEIVANGNPINEQADGYYTINDVPKISQTNNTNYAHFNTHNALMLDSNYSHIENNNTKVSKTGDYGFSRFKRGIFQLKKSFKKDTDSSYDNLGMKTVAYNPNKNIKNVAMTELESEYNHTQSGVHGTMKKDIQNEKDEYSHLDHKPKLLKEDANEVANENPYSVQSQLTSSELSTNLRANGYENEVNIGHDYFVLEAVGESGDDSIEDSDKSTFYERNSNSASGFQYEYAREVERSGTYQNEETRDIQSTCRYELSKDIDANQI